MTFKWTEPVVGESFDDDETGQYSMCLAMGLRLYDVTSGMNHYRVFRNLKVAILQKCIYIVQIQRWELNFC